MEKLKYLTEIPLENGESLAVYRTAGGGLFAVDASYITADVGPVFDPFDGREYDDNELDEAETE